MSEILITIAWGLILVSLGFGALLFGLLVWSLWRHADAALARMHADRLAEDGAMDWANDNPGDLLGNPWERL